MRVLYLTDSLSDLDGVGRYATRLIAALEKQRPDLEVEILLARKHRPTSAQVPAHWKVEVALPPDYFFYMTPFRYQVSLWQSTLKAWARARRCDLVHAIKDFPHNRVGLLAARMAGVPCVATAHGTYTVQPLLDERHARTARQTYAGFESMISVSGYTRRRLLAELGEEVLPPERIHVVPNCVDADYHAAPREVGEKPWHGQLFTLAIGELKERKGHHLSLEAFCRLAPRFPELQHYVVGRLSGDDYQLALQRRVAEAGLEDRVHWLGNITEDEKIDLLQRAAVFVHTPVTAADGGFEGFGIVYLEASSCRTPVLGTLDCGAEDAIVDGQTGFLVAQEADAVEGALERLLADAALRERMGEAGLAHAQASGWEENAQRVLALYDDALRAKRGRS